MSKPVELPSGTILNMERFIALFPITTTTASNYQLILEGYPAPINLEQSDADALKKLLQLDSDILVASDSLRKQRDEQLHVNQRAIALLSKRIERHQTMSKADSLPREKLFDEFKQIIDSERLPGQKLYSYS
ncbi:MAG TPA: hypothetical protein DDZ80_03470 [Cyanobacteria bacterium UBA8803]|nr:hypothetical protein [Cyanobacteria bacterium UBA9273]HBL57630.1 hypothetical protein [Cyanobacteria bacterium UBA8803]